MVEYYIESIGNQNEVYELDVLILKKNTINYLLLKLLHI